MMISFAQVSRMVKPSLGPHTHAAPRRAESFLWGCERVCNASSHSVRRENVPLHDTHPIASTPGCRQDSWIKVTVLSACNGDARRLGGLACSRSYRIRLPRCSRLKGSSSPIQHGSRSKSHSPTIQLQRSNSISQSHSYCSCYRQGALDVNRGRLDRAWFSRLVGILDISNKGPPRHDCANRIFLAPFCCIET